VRWIVRGDIDGFFGLALDNLVQLLLIDTLCRTVLGFPPELLYGQVLPAAAISILVGNVAYAFQARALAARARDVRTYARCRTASTRCRCLPTCSS
jgi:AGZA family xanthine/uracil permease-like MFS transporter